MSDIPLPVTMITANVVYIIFVFLFFLSLLILVIICFYFDIPSVLRFFMRERTVFRRREGKSFFKDLL